MLDTVTMHFQKTGLLKNNLKYILMANTVINEKTKKIIKIKKKHLMLAEFWWVLAVSSIWNANEIFLMVYKTTFNVIS